MPEKLRHLANLMQAYSRMACAKTSTTMFLHVPYVNSLNNYRKLCLDSDNPFHLLQWSRRTFPWISSRLPAYGSQSIIMVVINRFSKAAHFGTLPAKFLHTGGHFTSIICILHGYQESVISDCDPFFISKFWTLLFQLHGTKLRMSTMYHPQLNS